MKKKLRVVTFNYLPVPYRLVTDWIKTNGHEHVLAVTTPGPLSKPTPSYKSVLNLVPRTVGSLVTTRLREEATPILRSLKPDIILCFTFPYRLTPEICSTPTHGAVNIHPSALPEYRGPNPMRQFYDGAPCFGSTAHWIGPDYDTGPILSVKSAPTPILTTTATTAHWGDLMRDCINEGMAKAIAGHPGVPQDESKSFYSGKFEEHEKWLNFSEPADDVLRKSVGLNVAGNLARAYVDGAAYHITHTELVEGFNVAYPGEVIQQTSDGFVVGTGDSRAIRFRAKPFSTDTRLPPPLEDEHFVFPF